MKEEYDLFGICITKQGLRLLAKLHAGDTLEITRVMVGGGKVPEGTNPKDFTDLVSPIARATSTEPVAVENSVTFTVEYRSDLNGGLDRNILVNEYGIFALDPQDGEILLYYANLGDYPEPVWAYWDHGPICSRRYPVSITVADGVDTVLGYIASAYMTAEDVKVYCTSTILPMFLEEADRRIAAHDASGDAHPALRRSMTELDARLELLWLRYGTEVSGNPFTVTFEDLEGETVTGVWNQAAARVEF